MTYAEVSKCYWSEGEAFKGNCELFGKIVDYFKDAIECFFVLCRQKSKRSFNVATSTELLNLVELVRFEVGLICETARISKSDGDIVHKFKKNKESKVVMPKIIRSNMMVSSMSETNMKNTKKKKEAMYNINELQQIKVRDKLRCLHKNKLQR